LTDYIKGFPIITMKKSDFLALPVVQSITDQEAELYLPGFRFRFSGSRQDGLVIIGEVQDNDHLNANQYCGILYSPPMGVNRYVVRFQLA
jgi:hypothetical protein